MGPPQDRQSRERVQGPSGPRPSGRSASLGHCTAPRGGAERRSAASEGRGLARQARSRGGRFVRRRRPRCRLCLLKGCERPFHSSRAQARYCGAPCREEARRWRLWRARQCYRATDNGQARRRAQSRRYRERVRQRREATRHAREEGASDRREGERPADFSKKISCSRPGCYELFDLHPRSPLQKFCCALCRQALGRVLQRERRWRRRRGPWARRGADAGHETLGGG